MLKLGAKSNSFPLIQMLLQRRKGNNLDSNLKGHFTQELSRVTYTQDISNMFDIWITRYANLFLNVTLQSYLKIQIVHKHDIQSVKYIPRIQCTRNFSISFSFPKNKKQ